MLIDKVTIKILSGRGGNGATTFRREKFIAHGGPDGGDGGRGGSIYLEASDELNTLLDFRYESIYKAQDGDKGAKKNCNGRMGKDLVIKVPCGTIVSDEAEGIVIADMTELGQKVLVAEGGRGGKGNAKFKTNKNRVPTYCEPGEPGIDRELTLELKLIADVGIIGYPNAGKSTLISKISAAKPKIADYAFTTIEPNLGMVQRQDGRAYAVADIPGLIDGASDGVGLGHDFLRHIERTRLLVHVVDAWGLTATNNDFPDNQDPIQNYIKLNLELEKYSEKLAKKPQILVLNKIEGFPEEDLNTLVENFKTLLESRERDDSILQIKTLGFFQISAFTGEGTGELKDFIGDELDKLPIEENFVEVEPDPLASDHDDSFYQVDRERPDYWRVHCGKLERIMRITDLRERGSLAHLFRVAKDMGIFAELKRGGAEPGHTLNIDGVEFELDEATLV